MYRPSYANLYYLFLKHNFKVINYGLLNMNDLVRYQAPNWMPLKKQSDS